MSNEELLAYRLEQLEKRMHDQERLHKERPVTIATIVMSVCGLVQAGTAVLYFAGHFR